jgi:Recombination endonuclease VII
MRGIGVGAWMRGPSIKNTGVKKFCRKCGADTDRRGDGRCRPCEHARATKWARANPEKHRQNGKKWRTNNPERLKELRAAQYAANPEKYRAISRERTRASTRLKAGWLGEEIERAWAAQGGECAICARPMIREGQLSHSMTTDHDHTSGKARGLACSSCNKMIGFARDNPNILRAGAVYLESFK